MIAVRKSTTEDIDQISEIEIASFDRPWSHVLLEADVAKNPNALYYVAFDDFAQDTLLGFIGTHNIAGEINITNVAVRPEYRGQKIASALMKCALDYFGSLENLYGITLEVRASNDSAIALYRKFGFKEEGIRKAYYSNGEDAIIMWIRY